MNTRAILAIGLLFGVLLAAFLLTGRRERQIERREFESGKLFEFSAADITSLSIQQEAAEPVEAVRRDGGWDFAGAYRHIPANGPLWDQLAEVMALARNERRIDGAEDDLASFELDPPRLTVIAATKQGAAYQIDFGGLDPTQRHRYHRMAGQGVFLSTADWFSIMNRNLGELRDRRLFHNLADGLERLEYKRYLVASEDGADVSTELQKRMAGIDDAYAKDSAGQWRLVSPVDALARQDALEVLARVLPSLGGRAFIDAPENLADFGLDHPFARLTVFGPGGNSETLLLGGIDSGDATGEAGLYVKHETGQSVVVVDARLFTLLPAEPQAFRERRLFTREALGLKSLRYRDGTNEFTLENSDAGWRLTDAPAGETDQVAVSMYIAQLKRVEGESFPDKVAPDVFGTPRIALEFTFNEGPGSRVEIGAPVPGSDPIEFYARQDFDSLTTIPFDGFQALQATPFDFHVKSLLKCDPKTVNGIELTIEGARFVFSRANGRWAVTEPANATLSAQSDVTNFLAALTNLQARGVADPPPAAAVQGIESPILEVTIRTEDAALPTIGPIRIGNLKSESSRERFATVEGRSAVYFVDQSIVDLARDLAAQLLKTA